MTTSATAKEIEVLGSDDVEANHNSTGEVEAVVALPAAEHAFPDAFYDPVTGQIMQDPIVDPAGDSYDKTTDRPDAAAAAADCYPNRALQAIIQRETAMASPSAAGSIRRIDAAIQSGWGRLLDQSAFSGTHSSYRPLPSSFYCPITCELMVDPVIAPDGTSYEREAMVNWIRVNGVSPLTRVPVAVTALRRNNALYTLIQSEKRRADGAAHPSIRRWKESTVETSRRAVAENAAAASAPTSSSNEPEPMPPAAPATIPYPTTEAELYDHRRQVQLRVTALRLLTASVFVVALFFPYVAVVAILLVLALIVCGSPARRA